MLRGLQVAFNEPVALELLQTLKAKGVDLVRLDYQKTALADLVAWIAPVLEAGLVPLVIVSKPDQITALIPCDVRVALELGNEPDLEGPDPHTYAVNLSACALAAKAAGLTLFGGAVSNLIPKALDYLKAIGPFPEGVGVSVHRYAPGDLALAHHAEYASRTAEVLALRAIIGDRPYGVSEMGYHTDPSQDDAQCSAQIAAEWAFWEGLPQPPAFVCLYQLNDGAGQTALDHYGVRYLDGTFKPQMGTFARPPAPAPAVPQGATMSYLSYKNATTPTPSDVIDATCKFQQSGNLFGIDGPALGYLVSIVGSPLPNNRISFDKRPVGTFTGEVQLTSWGALHTQPDGTVAIEIGNL